MNASYDLWFPAIAADAAARCGSDQLRADLYDLLVRFAGTQVGCGAWVAYSGPVDYYLGALAGSLARVDAAAAHFDAAAEHCEQLDAPLWLELAGNHRDSRAPRSSRASANRFQRTGPVWSVAFDGTEAFVPDAKGLRDIATLLARPGEQIPATELAGTAVPSRGQPALDRTTLAEYRIRLAELDGDIAQADGDHDLERAAHGRVEHDAIVTELRRSVGRGGRPRRLGDDTEKARKTVTARIHRAVRMLELHNALLAAHLRDNIETGTTCSYTPRQPVLWTLGAS